MNNCCKNCYQFNELKIQSSLSSLNKEILVSVSSSYLLRKLVCTERHHAATWQQFSLTGELSMCGQQATVAVFDLYSNCRLFCVLGLAEHEALDTP